MQGKRRKQTDVARKLPTPITFSNSPLLIKIKTKQNNTDHDARYQRKCLLLA